MSDETSETEEARHYRRQLERHRPASDDAHAQIDQVIVTARRHVALRDVVGFGMSHLVRTVMILMVTVFKRRTDHHVADPDEMPDRPRN